MANYKEMYFLLFNKITFIIEELQKLQQQAEDIYISQEEPIVKVIDLFQKRKEKTMVFAVSVK